MQLDLYVCRLIVFAHQLFSKAAMFPTQPNKYIVMTCKNTPLHEDTIKQISLKEACFCWISYVTVIVS